MGVEFEWDPAKAASNLRKHGISFPFATRVFLDEQRLERHDSREDYGEERWITLGLVEEVELVLIYATRKDRIRILSARKADHHEREEYWNR